jgi:hypothetical protein
MYRYRPEQCIQRGTKRCFGCSYKRLADGKMDVVTLAQGETHWQSRVDADGGATSHVKVAAREVAGDGGGLFLGEIAGTFIGTEGGRGGAREGPVIVVVLLVREVGCVHRVHWGNEGRCSRRAWSENVQA